jgi:hypothetical protein
VRLAISVDDYNDARGRLGKLLYTEIERKSLPATSAVGSRVCLSSFLARYHRGFVGAVVGDDHYAIAICELRY